MSNLTHGMNVTAVRDAAAQLERRAGELRNVTSRIDGALTALGRNWSGSDYRQFCDGWTSQHRTAIGRLAESIDGLARSARNNADEQDRASDGGDVAGLGSCTVSPVADPALGLTKDQWKSAQNAFGVAKGGLDFLSDPKGGPFFNLLPAGLSLVGAAAEHLEELKAVQLAAEGAGHALETIGAFGDVAQFTGHVAPLLAGLTIVSGGMTIAENWGFWGTPGRADDIDFAGGTLKTAGGGLMLLAPIPFVGQGAAAVGVGMVAAGTALEAASWTMEHWDEIGDLVGDTADVMTDVASSVGDAISEGVDSALDALGGLFG